MISGYINLPVEVVGGTGTVTTTGLPAIGGLAIMSGAMSITTATGLAFDGTNLLIPANTIGANIFASGDFGSNSPIGSYDNGFFASTEGDLYSVVRAGSEIGFVGFTDLLTSTSMGFNYGTANPRKIVVGAAETDPLCVFDNSNNSGAGNFFLDLSLNPNGAGSFVATNGQVSVPTFCFADRSTGLYFALSESQPSTAFAVSGLQVGVVNASGFFQNVGNVGRFGLDSDNAMTFTADHTAHYDLNGANVVNILAGGALNLKQNTTPATPTSGFNNLYFKSDNNLYMLNSSGVEAQVNGGGGGGGITALTGDVTASGSGSVAATVASLGDFTVSGDLIATTDAVGNIGAIGANRPKHVITSGLIMNGDFGPNNPIGIGYGNGFWASAGGSGDLLTRMFTDPEQGYIGWTDEVAGINVGFVYNTASPGIVGVGATAAGAYMNFDASGSLGGNFILDLGFNPHGAGIISLSNGGLSTPTLRWAGDALTGVYAEPAGLNGETAINFVGPGNFGGVGGQYSNGRIGSNGDGGGGFFGNGFVGAEPTASFFWYWDPTLHAHRYGIGGVTWSVNFMPQGDLIWSNTGIDGGFGPVLGNIGDGAGHDPATVFAGQLSLTNVASSITPASGVLTLTNGPGASTGNPTIYIKINVNGTNYAVPAYAF